MKLFDDYKELQQQIGEYFGCDDCDIYHINDYREDYWSISGDKLFIRYSKKTNNSSNLRREFVIYKPHFRKDDFTLIYAINDRQIFLALLDNKKEV